MEKKKTLRVSQALLALLTMTSCLKPTIAPTLSDTAQLTDKEYFKCVVFDEYLPENYKQYSQYIQRGNKTQVEKAMGVLTRIPQEYKDYIFSKNTTIHLDDSWSGLTSWDDQNIHIRSAVLHSGGWDAFPHELGHAVTDHFRKGQGFWAQLDEVTTYSYNHYRRMESAYLKSYNEPNVYEYFAELFHSWYCSEEARADIEQRMPHTYDFAKEIFAPAIDEVPNGSTRVYWKIPSRVADSGPLYFSVQKTKKPILSVQYCAGEKCVENPAAMETPTIYRADKMIYETSSQTLADPTRFIVHVRFTDNTTYSSEIKIQKKLQSPSRSRNLP